MDKLDWISHSCVFDTIKVARGLPSLSLMHVAMVSALPPLLDTVWHAAARQTQIWRQGTPHVIST